MIFLSFFLAMILAGRKRDALDPDTTRKGKGGTTRHDTTLGTNGSHKRTEVRGNILRTELGSKAQFFASRGKKPVWNAAKKTEIFPKRSG